MEDLQKTEKELIAEQNKKVSEGLLFCIEYLSKIRGYFYSIKSLTSNLPLHINGFSPLLFLRAVKRIGLSGEIFKKPLQELTHSFLPCIIFLKDGGVCYIEKKTHEGFFVVHADHPKGEFVKQEQLEEIYEGHCILLKQLTDKSFQTYHSHWLWGTLHKMRSIYSSVLVASFFTNFLSVLIPLYAMNVYDRVLANNNYNTLWVLSVGIVIVIFFDFLLKVIKSHFVDTAGKNVDIVLSSSLFERILGLDLSKKQFTVGALASHVRELEVIREFCSSLSLLALVEIPFAIIFLIAVTYIGGMWFFIVSVIMIALILLLGWTMQKVIAHYVLPSFGVTTQKSTFMVESIVGIETIRAFGAQGEKLGDWESLNHDGAGLSQNSSFFSSIALNLSQFLGSMNYVVFIIVGVYLIGKQELTMGGLIACSILGSRVIQPFSVASSLLLRLNQAIMAYKTIDGIMKVEHEDAEDSRTFTKPRLTGRIEFNKVEFSYPGQQSPTLKNISFVVEPNDKLMIMGRMGSGKTTIQKLILGFYKSDSGELLLDGLDIRQLDKNDVRAHIGYISQDIYLFSGTVLDNIVLGHRKSFNPEQIERAIVMSGAIHFIRNHPKGVNMLVGEGGGFLSGGQRQTIGIARALLHNYPILLLDEPTTMLDQGTEQWFLNQFKTYAENKTVIFISHNPTLINMSNKLMLIEDGAIRYFGDSQEFINVVNSATANAVKNMGVSGINGQEGGPKSC